MMVQARRALLPLLLLALAGCKADLYSHLAEREAVAMTAILMRSGIDTDRVVAKDGTTTLRVEKDQLPQAVGLLSASQYPRREFANLGDVFEQKGIVSSPTAERARFIYAMTQELSQTLSDMDGVLTARVHVVLPHNDPLRSADEPAAAAVFIRYDDKVGVDRLLPQIKMLVANSIEGLSYDKVSVVAVPVTLAPIESGAIAADTSGSGALGWALWLMAALVPAAGGGYVLWRRRRAGPPATSVADATSSEPGGARPALRSVA